MKKKSLLFALIFMSMLFSSEIFAQASKIAGTWITIDDETGEAKSHVTIYKESDGLYYGKIVKLLVDNPNEVCTACKGSLKNKPIVGLVIITKMVEDDGELTDGDILDPKSGSSYYCTLWLNEKNKDILNVKGSLDAWGIAGRSQTWHRLK